MVYRGVDGQVLIGARVSLSLARRFEALLWWSGYLFVYQQTGLTSWP